MRSAVYNRFLHTMGGGERHSGMIAQVLAQDDREVDIITHHAVDLDQVSDYLGLDLSGVRLVVFPDRGDRALAERSAEYDVFVNASYMSRLAPRAATNLYLCYFPTPFDHDLEWWQRSALRIVGRRSLGIPPIRWKGGWYPAEGGMRGSWNWTAGDAVIQIRAGQERVLEFEVGRPGAPEAVQLTVVDDRGHELAAATATPGTFARASLRLPASRDDREIRFTSPTFVAPGDDGRALGIAVRALRLRGDRRSLNDVAVARFPWLARNPRDLSFLRAYDRVLANSEYTRMWIRRLWQIEPDVLYPPIPVSSITPSRKAERIVVVGRFFAPEHGHGKRQLELVRAFGDMQRSGALAGWRLDLVGGCEPAQEPYLRSVVEAARGLPAEIHANAPRAMLEELVATASIFWTATGLGLDERRHPWAFEHFGIATVEAMAAGCVPVVIDKAGQREIVNDGVEGYRWTTLRELEEKTIRVIRDPSLRARMAEASVRRAQAFSEEAFTAQWRRILAGVRRS